MHLACASPAPCRIPYEVQSPQSLCGFEPFPCTQALQRVPSDAGPVHQALSPRAAVAEPHAQSGCTGRAQIAVQAVYLYWLSSAHLSGSPSTLVKSLHYANHPSRTFEPVPRAGTLSTLAEPRGDTASPFRLLLLLHQEYSFQALPVHTSGSNLKPTS